MLLIIYVIDRIVFGILYIVVILNVHYKLPTFYNTTYLTIFGIKIYYIKTIITYILKSLY